MEVKKIEVVTKYIGIFFSQIKNNVTLHSS